MTTEIYYFSGTGNSLFVARELQKRIPNSSLIPIVGCLDQKRIPIQGKSVGIVFPVHALTIPIAVKKFLRKADLSSTEYIFAAATRLGTIFRGFRTIDRLLKKKHRRLKAHFILNMGNNECRHEGYRVPSVAELQLMEKVIMDKLDRIQAIVNQKQVSREKDLDSTVNLPYHPIIDFCVEKLILLGMTVSEYIGGVNYFYTDSKCRSCGICAKVCLSGKIDMGPQKPVWQKKVFCYMCFACLNYCPQQAVQIKDIPGVKSFTKENGRYPHPYATMTEIASQKELER